MSLLASNFCTWTCPEAVHFPRVRQLTPRPSTYPEPINLSRGRQLTPRASAQSGSEGEESEDSMASLEANFNHMGREAKMPVTPPTLNPKP